ncbi:MAG: ATP-dependent DNA helicase, partial [Spirochaetota bacterium]
IFNQLLDAIPVNAGLIMVGDVDQLPSVGPGNVLKDIIRSGKIPYIRLNEIHRQKRDSFIISNAHRINKGKKLSLPPNNDKNKLWDFYKIEQEDKEEILKLIITLCKERIPQRFKFDSINDIQILTPMRVRDLGSNNLNYILQKNLNPNKSYLERGRTRFKLGDKVMQTRNNYDKDVFNGDIGRISFIDKENNTLTVSYDNKEVTYETNELDELELAYAISIHKSQGSEYKAVIIPIHTQHYIMLKRNLLYTAVTRGKELVILIGMNKALNIAIQNISVQTRYTLLSERILNQLQNEQIKNKYELF